MKKMISFAICFLLTAAVLPAVSVAAADGVAISKSTFPDANFRTYVKNHFDADGDGTLSGEELAGVTSVSVSNADIASLQGIEYFPELSYLECQYNTLTSLDISRNQKLLDLRCDGNQLTSIDAGANAGLQYLWCSENRLTSIDVSAGNLLMLDCAKNELASLDVSADEALTFLHCGDNHLTSLNVSANRELDELNCQNNQLAALDVSALPALVYLNCDGNRLTSIDVRGNPLLSVLECCSNSLTSLDVTQNGKMTYLRCSSNRLTSIDVSQNIDMIGLDCSENAIKKLDLSCTRGTQNLGPELSDLYCGENPLEGLDLSQQTKLMYFDCSGAGLTSLNLDTQFDLVYLNCSSNSLPVLDLSHNRGMKSLVCSKNKVRAPMTKSGKKWKFDLSGLLGSEELSRITISTANATLSGNTVTVKADEMPAKLVYLYDTKGPAEAKQLKVIVTPIASASICSHTGKYVTTKEPTVFKAGKKTRTCPLCGTVQTAKIKKLTPTIKLSASSITLKTGQSRKLIVSGLANGDSVKSWKSSDTSLVKVSKKGKVTAKKKAGTTKVTVTLASGKKKSVTVKVKKAA